MAYIKRTIPYLETPIFSWESNMAGVVCFVAHQRWWKGLLQLLRAGRGPVLPLSSIMSGWGRGRLLFMRFNDFCTRWDGTPVESWQRLHRQAWGL